MLLLLAGLILFLGVHSTPMLAPAGRERVIARIGDAPWKGAFGLIALSGLVLIVLGYDAARQDPIALYSPPIWTRHLAVLLLVPVFPLLFAAYLPGRIRQLAKHPMLLAVKLWALAHLLANGTLADVLLFGSFLAWAVADRVSLKHRVPPVVHGAPPGKWNDLIAVGGGLVLYVAFLLWLHRWWIGVSPLG
jgi:uncharacterized membrane protein